MTATHNLDGVALSHAAKKADRVVLAGPDHILIPRGHLWTKVGMHDDTGHEVTAAHVMETTQNILGHPLMKLVEHSQRHLDDPEHPIHQDVHEAAHGRLRGRWHIDRYDAPIEYYAAKLLGVPERDVPDINLVPAVIRHQALAMLRRNHRSESSEFEETFDNLFMTAGVNALWQQAVGSGATNAGVGSAASANAFYNATQARIGVATSTAGTAPSQTDLQDATALNKFWTVVSGAPVISTNQIQFTASVGSANANESWQEFGVDNAGNSNNPLNGSRTSGTLLDRVTSNQGTKASGLTLSGRCAVAYDDRYDLAAAA